MSTQSIPENPRSPGSLSWLACEFVERRLIASQPVTTLDDYLNLGGGDGVANVERLGSTAVISEIRSSGLRGRGGAGFPTGIKWEGLASDPAQRRYVVCNAAEGEPGTFKDRYLLQMNPYQVLEGLAIAAAVVNASGAFIGIKDSYRRQVGAIQKALDEMSSAGVLGNVPLRVVQGPDDYLLGEEKALLEVIEGGDPLPRLYPPYIQGLFDTRTEEGPAVVNNVETLANVPLIVRHGADWFREEGTPASPGTMVFTISGDVEREAVVELPLGTPLSHLVHEAGGGIKGGRTVGAVFPGASNAPIPARRLDTPMDFEHLAAIGSGLGSAGFVVYDESACVIEVAASLSRFLYISSCGQCPPCKLGTEAFTVMLDRLQAGLGSSQTLEEMSAWTLRVTDANRCGLGAGARQLIVGLFRDFPEELAAHLDGGCPKLRDLPAPLLVDWLEESGRFVRSGGQQ